MIFFTTFLRIFLTTLVLFPLSVQATTYTVDSAGDENEPADGDTTLREAVLAANAYPGDDVITFSPSLENAVIETSGNLVISDNLEIDGQNAPNLTLRLISDDQLFDVNEGISFSVSDIRGKTGDRTAFRFFVDACGDTSLSNLRVSGFRAAVTNCSALSSLSVSRSEFHENEDAIRVGSVTMPSSVQIDETVFSTSDLLIFSQNETIDIEVSNSGVTGSDVVFELGGKTSSLIRNSSFYDLSGFLLYMQPYGYRPSLVITNSTFSNITTDNREIAFFRYSDVTINSTTIANNHITRNPLRQDSSFIYASDSSLDISHSIISNNTYHGFGLSLYNTPLTGTYSVIPAISESGASASSSLDPLTTLYMGVSVPLQPLVLDSIHPPYHLLPEGSFLIDAGDPAATAGQDGIPADEQRQSSRVLGAAIDLGATEFNRAPVLDVKALATDRREQQTDLEEAGTPDADIVLDLDNYVSDPDGHGIVDITVTQAAGLDFDEVTHVISGPDNAFTTSVITVVMKDGTWLKGSETLNRPSPAATSDDITGNGGGSGGGSAGILSVLLLALLGWRRKTVHA